MSRCRGGCGEGGGRVGFDFDLLPPWGLCTVLNYNEISIYNMGISRGASMENSMVINGAKCDEKRSIGSGVAGAVSLNFQINGQHNVAKWTCVDWGQGRA